MAANPLETNIGFMHATVARFVHPSKYVCEVDRSNVNDITSLSIYDARNENDPSEPGELRWLISVPTFSHSPKSDMYMIHKVDGEKSELVASGPDNIQHLCRAAKELGIFILG